MACLPQLRNPIHAMNGAVAQLATGALSSERAEIELATLSRGIDVMVRKSPAI